MTKIDDLLSEAQGTLTAQRVYASPYEKDGITFIPAASVRGGGGAGEGEGGESEPSGLGGGFGMSARPVGGYMIKNDEVSWIPAADTTRVIILAEIVAIVAMLVVRSILKARTRRTTP